MLAVWTSVGCELVAKNNSDLGVNLAFGNVFSPLAKHQWGLYLYLLKTPHGHSPKLMHWRRGWHVRW